MGICTSQLSERSSDIVMSHGHNQQPFLRQMWCISIDPTVLPRPIVVQRFRQQSNTESLSRSSEVLTSRGSGSRQWQWWTSSISSHVTTSTLLSTDDDWDSSPWQATRGFLTAKDRYRLQNRLRSRLPKWGRDKLFWPDWSTLSIDFDRDSGFRSEIFIQS